MYGFRTHSKAGLAFGFAFMALFFIISASTCYIVGYFTPEVKDIMKWIAFGILMMGLLMMLICLVFFINFLIFMHNKKQQARLNFGKTNEFDNEIFKGNPNIHEVETEFRIINNDSVDKKDNHEENN